MNMTSFKLAKKNVRVEDRGRKKHQLNVSWFATKASKERLCSQKKAVLWLEMAAEEV
jgi:hypothetical protein